MMDFLTSLFSDPERLLGFGVGFGLICGIFYGLIIAGVCNVLFCIADYLDKKRKEAR